MPRCKGSAMITGAACSCGCGGSAPFLVLAARSSARLLARLRAGVDGSAQEHSVRHCKLAERGGRCAVMT